MLEPLQQTFFGNSLLTWILSFVVILLSLLLGRAVYWLFSKLVRTFTSRTKTQLDDIIVDKVEEPLVFLLIISGIWIGLKILVLPEAAERAVNNAYQILLAMLVAWTVTRLFDAFNEHILKPWAERTENDLDDLLLPILSKGVKMIVWALAIIIGLNNAGYDVGAMIAGLGIGGLALAMAAKDTVSNVFGGFTIFTDKPFKLNDRIVVDGYDGTVKEIGVRSTRLVTLAGREISIPNSTFAETPVENISREPSRKITLNLGLTYDTTPDKMQQAMDILKQINEDNKNTLQKTIIAFDAFGDFAMNIMFIYYIKKGKDLAETQTQINMEILKQFNANGLEFAFPTQTLYNINQG